MNQTPDAAEPLDRLTPELAAEVRRNLTLWVSLTVIAVLAFSLLFAFAVDPSLSEVTGGVAVLMFALVLGLLLPSVGLLLTLAYLFGCWPAMLRGRYLREHYGIEPADLSGTAWREAMGSSGFWAAAGRGAIVGWAFVSAAILIWWGLTGKLSFGGPSLILVVLAAQFSARSWFVQLAVVKQITIASVPD